MSRALPVTKDGFSYIGDTMYVEASGRNHHARATIPELRAHFYSSSNEKDPPAHWYEAQLLHYGLPPSKRKGTAKMRLFEAVSKGIIAVPAHIKQLEADLEKDCIQNGRDAKKALKQQTAAKPAANGTKRKANNTSGFNTSANFSLNMALTVNAAGEIQFQNAEGPKKKAKTDGEAVATNKAATSPGITTKKTSSAKSVPSKKTSEPGSPEAADLSLLTSDPVTVNGNSLRRSQNTKREGALIGSRTSRVVAMSSSAKGATLHQTKQTTRRGKAICSTPAKGSPSNRSRPATKKPAAGQIGTQNPGGVAMAKPSLSYPYYFDDGYVGDDVSKVKKDDDRDLFDEHFLRDLDDVPEDKKHDDRDMDSDVFYDLDDAHDDDNVEEDEPLAQLGLLNGRYKVPSSDDGLIFTLDKKALWGSFDIGGITGILHLHERPWDSSHQELRFSWRGEDSYGNEFRGDGRYGNIWFLGGGHIRGDIFSDVDGWHEFSGNRISGQDTRSEIGAWSMRRQWDERDAEL